MIQLAVFISASFMVTPFGLLPAVRAAIIPKKPTWSIEWIWAAAIAPPDVRSTYMFRLTRINPVLGAAGLPTGPLTLRFNSTASWSARKNLDDVLRVGRKLSG